MRSIDSSGLESLDVSHLLPWQILLAALAGWVNEHQQHVIAYLHEENCVPRGQLGRNRLRLTDNQPRRLAAKGKLLGRGTLAEIVSIVSPDTLLAWLRRLITKKWDYSSDRKGPGRPAVMREIAELAIRMARENPSWGYGRIQGALANLGNRGARTTVANIIEEHGIDPAPRRRRGMPWKAFLKAHWHTISAASIAIGSSVTPFVPCMQDAGTEPLRLPARSPNLNALAERFVRSIKEECLGKMILFGERSLNRAIREYLVHYHAERNHQGLDNRLIDSATDVGRAADEVTNRHRLGGVLRYCYRKAA